MQLKTGLQNSTNSIPEVKEYVTQIVLPLFKEKFVNFLTDAQVKQQVVTKEKVQAFFEDLRNESKKMLEERING